MMYINQGHKLNHTEKQTCLINKNTADVTRSLQMGTETRSPWDIGFDSWIKRFEEEENKVTYPKYYKHWLYTLAATIDHSCLLFILFWPKNVHFKAKIDSFLTFQLFSADATNYPQK